MIDRYSVVYGLLRALKPALEDERFDIWMGYD